MHKHRSFAFLALAAAALLAGCSGDEPPTDTPVVDDTTDDTTEIDDTTDDAPAAGAIDICAMYTAEMFEQAFGVPADGAGEADTPGGSLLGGCTYTGGSNNLGYVSARPADEWEYAVSIFDEATIAGLPFEARFSSENGMGVLFDGQDYYLHILASTSGGWDREVSQAIAEAIYAAL